MKVFISTVILFCFMYSAQASTTEKNHQNDGVVKPIAEIFDKHVLIGCTFRTPYFIDLYMSNFDSSDKKLSNGILTIDNYPRQKLNSNITTGLKTLKFSGIKAMKDFERNTDYRDESIWSIDIDVLKYGMHILRFAKFGIDDHIERIDYAGYYYIVKGNPQKILPKLRQIDYSTNIDEIMIIEETEGNNTRVRCVF